MNPSDYLHEARRPILALLVAYAGERNLLRATDTATARDLRQFLKKILDAQQQRIDDPPDQKARSRYTQERRALSFLHEVLNTHAHEHGRSTQNLAMSVSAAFEFFIQAADLGGTEELVGNFRQLSGEFYAAALSEYVTPAELTEEDDDIDRKFDSVHDKLDALLLRVKEGTEPVQTVRTVQEPPTKIRLEEIRREIESFSRDRGKEMKGYQHLLQWRRMEDLIQRAPGNVDELRSWSTTLANHAENQRWFEGQINRWGSQIVDALRDSR